MDIQLKVNPTELKNKSSEITGLIENIVRQYEEIKTICSKSATYWESDAAEAFRNYIASIDGDMQEVIKRLGEHPNDLLNMAGLYEQNEINLIEIAEMLPTDVIF